MKTNPTLTIEIPKRFFLKNLTLQDWSWVHFKLAMIAWSIALYTFTPRAIMAALDWLAIMAPTVTIIGGVVSLVGLFMAVQPGRVGVLGLTIELSGLYFMTAGPIVYLIAQTYLASTLENGDQRYALTVLAYVICAALLCRILIVLPKRSRVSNSGTTKG